MAVLQAQAHATTGSVAEFNSYAHGYAAGMDHPTKRLLGNSADEFIAVKLRWLLRTFPGCAQPTHRSACWTTAAAPERCCG